MADISKISPDDGSTILNIKDSNAVHYDLMSEVGALNLIPFPYAETTKSFNSITFTVQDDYGIKVNGQKPSTGGSTAFQVYKETPILSSIFKQGHSYKLLGFNNTLTHNWSGLTMLVRVQNGDDSVHYEANWADGNAFTIPDEYFTNEYTVRIQLSVISNFNVVNQVVYPELIDTRVTYTNYIQPALTNRELSKIVSEQGLGILRVKNISIPAAGHILVTAPLHLPFFVFGQRSVSFMFNNFGTGVDFAKISDTSSSWSNMPSVTLESSGVTRITNNIADNSIRFVFISYDDFTIS